MQIIVADDHDDFSRIAAGHIAAAIRDTPTGVVIPATGDTPMGTYQELAAMRAAGSLDPTGLRVFQLDEYVGLAEDDDRSLWGWTLRSFVAPLGIPLAQTHRLPSNDPDLDAACRAFDAALAAAGGVDLAILGLGANGHLGYNEPPTVANAPTRPIPLTPESVTSGAVYWGSEERVPRLALTAGMPHLLGARGIVLLVSGAHKRDILDRTLNGPVTPDVPASFLQDSANVTVICDRAAVGG